MSSPTDNSMQSREHNTHIPKRVSLVHCPGCPGTHFIDQTGLELTEIHLPLPPKFWD
ncbi:hypothetical protein LEMLEM_LOCUS5296 [Lemmus lemmus]